MRRVQRQRYRTLAREDDDYIRRHANKWNEATSTALEVVIAYLLCLCKLRLILFILRYMGS